MRNRPVSAFHLMSAALLFGCGPSAAPPTPKLMSDSALAAWTAPQDTVWHLSSGALAGESGNVAYFVDALLVKPEMVAGPKPGYPPRLFEAGRSGHVKLAAIVDTAGDVEPRSIRVEESSDTAFTFVSVVALIRSKFRPGRVGDRPVRTLVELPYDFCIGSCPRSR